LFAGIAATAAAADPEEPFPSAQAGQRPDFMFGRPKVLVGVRAAWLAPREGGQLFDFIRDQLTIDRGAFRTPALSADAGFILTDRLSLLGGIEASRATTDSEYRHFIGSDGLPIAQSNTLRHVGIHASLKVALLSSGRRLSRLAWIPRTVTPFVGGGADFLHYEFTQTGEFVDFLDSSIFPETFSSTGWGRGGHVFGGADILAWRNVYLTAQGRYVWAHAKLGPDFVDFDGIDLSGFRLESGVTLVF
jgi:hypothetical protein